MTEPDARETDHATRYYKPKSSVSGLIVKYLILGMLDSLALYAAFLLVMAGRTLPAVAVVVAALGITWLYLSQRAIPLKYLLPGTISMLIFGVLPIIYSVYIAFTNYSTGHVMAKGEAIEAIERDGYIDFDSFSLTIADDAAGQRVYLLERFDVATAEDKGSFIGTVSGITPSPRPFKLNTDGAFEPLAPAGYKAIPINAADEWVSSGQAFKVPMPDGHFLIVDTAQTAYERSQRFVYNEQNGTMLDKLCGNVFKDDGRGSFIGVDCETQEQTRLEKGWMVSVGLGNFRDIVGNPRYSEAMGRVFVWTVVYAFSSVFLTFFVGLLVALLFNVPRMRFRKLYRSLLIIPYAIPGFLSILVWRGLLNDEWGAINSLTGLAIPWLTDPNWAKVSILLVNTWLGFPYMFLVATGALQAIPAELKEAASVDGANRPQIFRNVTLPLLLVAVGPLLVGSFSFNFNNFNQIYLLTEGGPALQNSNSAAGATDILISYTYKLAFASGRGNNYGLAAAVSILIFFIIGGMSFWSFRRSKALENMA